MTVSYILSFIDKGILSTAAVYGLRTDLVSNGNVLLREVTWKAYNFRIELEGPTV